ncbi:MAG: hypothetical protein ACP5UD_09550 [Conexivisphaera sp.]
MWRVTETGADARSSGRDPGEACGRLRDSIKDLYFTLMALLLSYYAFLVTEPSYYEYDSPLILIQCLYGTCPYNLFRIAWILGSALLSPLLLMVLWHYYDERVLRGRGGCSSPWRLVVEAYRTVVIISIPLALFVLGAPPVRLGMEAMPIVQAGVVVYLALVSMACLRWFRRCPAEG